MPKCAVVVPSYSRPDWLRRCLNALSRQEVCPEEIVVVARTDDIETRAVVAELQRVMSVLTLATVDRPGVIAAMEIGVRQTHADIIALTDDDAEPRPDWVARLKAAFREDSRIAGVGGRDQIGSVVASKPRVGHLGWFGRLTGNHHAGVGPQRQVSVLKGVNSAYRRDVLLQVGFDHRLRGSGAQVHWELALGLAIARHGWSLLYDPAIVVDHGGAPRPDGPRLMSFDVSKQSVADATFNETLVLLEHLTGMRRLGYLLWSSVVGTRWSPGLAQALRLMPELRCRSWQLWFAAERARRDARRVTAARS